MDATQVPSGLSGFRTFFSAFHHLRPEQARAVLAGAVAQGEGIAVFECAQRSVLALLFVLPTPVRILILSPFIRPFRWSRLVWTYLVRFCRLILLFDSVVSCLRMYSVEELCDLTGAKQLLLARGAVRGKPIPVPITYLVGVPRIR